MRLRTFLIPASAAVLIPCAAFLAVRYALPFELPEPPFSTVLLDGKDLEIGEIPSPEGLRHRPLSPSEIPEFSKKAVVALEDRRFFSHPGIDAGAVVRAAWRNLSGGNREGASTIDSGLVRNALWIGAERTWGKKIAEAAYAVRLNGMLSKEEILAEYLNRVSFGRQSKGFPAAARSYFGKEWANCTKAEQLALVAMAKNPSKYDPIGNPAAFRTRYAAVAETLAQAGVLDRGELPAFLVEKLSFPAPKNALPYVADAFKSGKFGRIGKRGGSGFLRTTFDADLTRRLRTIADGTLADIAWRNVTDYAFVVADRKTKEVLALEGGADYASPDAGQVNAAFAPRQVGSTMKPFTYLLAFQDRGVEPEDTVLDLPASFRTKDDLPYEPKNYSLRYRGAVTVAEALAGSLNVPAVKMAERVGVPELLRFVRSLGISSLTYDAEHYGLALTLGVGEIPLYDLARAYTVFSDAGTYCTFVTLRGVTSACRKAADSAAALKVESVLSNRSYKLREFGALTALDFPDRTVFVKTGTSRNFRDNYAIGYTERYLIAIWSGNKDGSNMRGVSGATGAGEIFSRFVESLEPAGRAPEPAVAKSDSGGYLQIVSPLPGSRYRPDPSIPAATQAVLPKFSTGVDFDRAEWILDGSPMPKEGIVIPKLAEGTHRLSVTLFRGRDAVKTEETSFEITRK